MIDTRDNYTAQQRVIQAIYFFATCFRQFMIFGAKFYSSAQMATMEISNANPACRAGQFTLGFTGVYISFLISAQKHRLWVLIRTTLLR